METLATCDMLSPDLRRALQIAPPLPMDLEIINIGRHENSNVPDDSPAQSAPSTSFVFSKKVIYSIVGSLFVAVVAFAIYKFWYIPMQKEKDLKNIPDSSPGQSNDKINSIPEDVKSNDKGQDFFHPPKKNP